MPRGDSNGFDRFLHLIGIVDAPGTRDTYGDEYESGNYGRRAPYTPNRKQDKRRTTTRQPASSRRTTQTRSRFDGGTSRFDDSGYDAQTSRASSRYDRSSDDRYDRYERASGDRYSRTSDDRYGRASEDRYARQSRDRYDSRDRYEDSGSSRYGASRRDAQPPVPQRPAMRVSRRSRTVMYSLRSLEDCCEVIDQLIANNTVVLTMDELDGSLMQRAVDTLSGAVFALHASIRKASDKTYLVAPMSVEVNEADDLGGRF